MSNLKISELPNANTLQDSDLIPVVQTSGTELLTTKTTVSSLRSAASSSATIFYPGAGKAVEATGSDLYIYDKNGSIVSKLNPTALTISHSQVDIDIQSLKPNKYECQLKFNDSGLRYTRLERNSSGNVIRASQIRMNSADGYFNAKENVEIAAGTIGNEPSDVALANLSGGTLRMISGSKTAILSQGPINIEPLKNLILKTPETITIEGKRCDIITTGQISLKSTTDSLKSESKNLTIDTTGQININNSNSGIKVKATGINNNSTLDIKQASINAVTSGSMSLIKLNLPNSDTTGITINENGITVEDNITGQGLKGNKFFNNYPSPNDFAQIAYVDKAASTLIFNIDEYINTEEPSYGDVIQIPSAYMKARVNGNTLNADLFTLVLPVLNDGQFFELTIFGLVGAIPSCISLPFELKMLLPSASNPHIAANTPLKGGYYKIQYLDGEGYFLVSKG